MTSPETLLGYKEAARLLGVTEHWLRRRIKTLPHYKLGQTVQFDADQIAAIRKAHQVTPRAYEPKLTGPLSRRKSA